MDSQPRFGLLHASGAPVTEPLSGLPLAFDTIDEARAWLEPGIRVCRLVDRAGWVDFVPVGDG